MEKEEKAKQSHCLGAFLDHGYGGAMGMSNFHLTCVLSERAAGIADDVSVVTARVYRHLPPGWSRWKHGWSSPSSAGNRIRIHLRGADSARYAGRSKGFIFCGVDDGDGAVLAAREGTGLLSLFRLPEHVRGQLGASTTFRFIYDDGNTDSLVRVVSLISNELRVFLKQENGGNGCGGEWGPVRSLRLPEATGGLPGYKECFFVSRTAKIVIVTAGKGYVVLTPAEETWLFSVDPATMQVDREHVRNKLAGDVYPYRAVVATKGVRLCVAVCDHVRRRDGPCYRICKCKTGC